MRRISYSKFTEDDLGIDVEDLLRALSDYLLGSGYQDPYMQFSEMNQHTLDELRRAIEQALMGEDIFSPERLQEMRDRLDAMSQEQRDQLIQRLMEKLEEAGYINTNAQQPQDEANAPGGQGRNESQMQFEVTDKAVDFLGFKTLKDLLGSLGKSSFGSHDTRNLDVSATLFSAMQREGVKLPLNLEYSDLHVHQSEYQSSCATVLMLDCSHSMILYGEDRFTPAKKVALALSHLIRTQYPGDSLRCVLFHDSAEELRISDLARVQVGPYYTNTRDGLILAQRLLAQEKKDMKQIIMITDGKPSALTLEDGRIYKNAFGLDPLVISQTLEEVGRCKKRGILINTFMLASDYGLVQFVQKVTEMCKGKAYFTTPYTLGNYLLMDYMNRKTRTIH